MRIQGRSTMTKERRKRSKDLILKGRRDEKRCAGCRVEREKENHVPKVKSALERMFTENTIQNISKSLNKNLITVNIKFSENKYQL